MWLEYLPDGSPDCPLIRLYNFTMSEARGLWDGVSVLAFGRTQRLTVHELPGVRGTPPMPTDLRVEHMGSGGRPRRRAERV